MAGSSKKEKAAQGKRAVSFSIAEELHRRFRADCILHGREPAHVLETLLREFLDRGKRGSKSN